MSFDFPSHYLRPLAVFAFENYNDRFLISSHTLNCQFRYVLFHISSALEGVVENPHRARRNTIFCEII